MNTFDGLARASVEHGLSRRRLLQSSAAAFAITMLTPRRPARAETTAPREAATCPGGTIDWYPGCKNPQTKPGYVNSYNGCGADGKKISKYIPNYPADADFYTACNDHDLCYGNCGSDKHACDKKLQKGTRSACLKRWSGNGIGNGLALASCLEVAELYYVGVVGLGSDAFNDAQRKACNCCPGCDPGLTACGEVCCDADKACCNGSCIASGEICCARADGSGFGCDPWRICCACPDNSYVGACCCCPDAICTPGGCLGGTGCA